jgi:hypothetical protein
MALNIPNNHKIYHNLPFPGHQKYTKIGIFGMKIYHLVTLLRTDYQGYIIISTVG